jgi:hypothetical protein
MDRLSVEAAISAEPAINGRFTWQDDSKLTFTPDTPFMPATALTITIDTGAQSTKGMSLLQPIQLTYSTIGYLDLVQELPAVDASKSTHISYCGSLQPASRTTGCGPCHLASWIFSNTLRGWKR